VSIIALTTDFGTQDHYVASMKGVILGLAPDATVVDVTHEVPPQDILHGAFVLRQVWTYFPPQTIHVVVVDPTVGTARRIILGQYADRLVIAPDNGLITLLHREFPAQAMYVVENRRYFASELSTTFHGRDIMAPAAAHLSRGVPPREFGRVTDRLEMLPVAHRGVVRGGAIVGAVLHVDRYGTLVTNIAVEQLPLGPDGRRLGVVSLGGRAVGPIHATFAAVAPGEPVALIGSTGLLEIAVNRGRAADRFGRSPEITVVPG
jgi:S-adenosylmethionine hydrolase